MDVNNKRDREYIIYLRDDKQLDFSGIGAKLGITWVEAMEAYRDSIHFLSE